jgi:hypothetical protein
MKTAVQLRHPAGHVHPRAELLSGTPSEVISTALGPVALFSPGEVVAYRIRYRRRTRVFVFRTLDVDDPLAASLPGVRPHVELLLELGTCGRTRLVRGLFAYLTRTGRDPSALPDVFYRRVGAMLGGRLPAHKILPSLLSADRPKPKRARARRGVSPRKAEAAKGKAAPIDVVQGAAGSPRQVRRREA